ncbi:MAG: MCP four helix bundle domain-containing protein [Syntrophaceae bacterium]|nr:MCP four helix bundle domain-containing protein [Syntrophaceae bacterium]
MKIKQKLVIGYILTAIFVVIIGVAGIYGTEKIVKLLDTRDEYFRALVITASKMSIDIKDVETDVTMYLLLGDNKLKESYFNRITDLQKALATLKSAFQNQDQSVMGMIDVIQSEIEQAAKLAQAIIGSFDSDIETKGFFDRSDHSGLIKEFVKITAGVRKRLQELVDVQTDFLNRQEPIKAALELASYSKKLQGHLLAYLVLQDHKDENKVFDRYQALWEMTSILDDRLSDEFSRGMLNQIKPDIAQIIVSAQALLKIDSKDELKKRPVTQVNEEALIREIDTLCENVSRKALVIAGHNVTMEIAPKQEALKKARIVQFVILLVTVVSVMIACTLGYTANRRAIELDESRSKLLTLNEDLAKTNERLYIEMLGHQREAAEKAKLVAELQDTVGQVKILSGMLPICSSCKKIRDDSGYWRQVEEYVRDHSEAEFTHSICPDCLRRLYPEIADEILSSKNKDS